MTSNVYREMTQKSIIAAKTESFQEFLNHFNRHMWQSSSEKWGSYVVTGWLKVVLNKLQELSFSAAQQHKDFHANHCNSITFDSREQQTVMTTRTLRTQTAAHIHLKKILQRHNSRRNNVSVSLRATDTQSTALRRYRRTVPRCPQRGLRPLLPSPLAPSAPLFKAQSGVYM